MLATDLVQFALAMVGVIGAAYVSLHQPAVGGLSGLLSKINPKTLSLLPDFNDTSLTVTVLVIPLTVQWWSVWYPGAEPGGGSYIAQRILASKNERHALGATLWFNVAHYALRPWPWIIVALCSMLVFPTLGDIQRALPHVNPALIGNDLAYPAMLTLLPVGMKGLLIASLFAAYRSTMETHLNWGSSYLIVDFYQRFIAAGKTRASLSLGLARTDGVPHGRVRRVHAGAVDGERSVSTSLIGRRGNGAHLFAPLVLVAHQRLERDLGDGVVVRHRTVAVCCAQDAASPSPTRIRC